MTLAEKRKKLADQSSGALLLEAAFVFYSAESMQFISIYLTI